MNCNQAQPLIPSYLDGELSEAQAGPLRKHLLDCQPCRGSAQGEKNLKRWFVPEEHVAVPRDFASRVARRAFAGDRGERQVEQPVGLIAVRAREDSNLKFVLQLTSLAAAAVILLSLAIGSLKLPSGNKLQADSTREEKLEHAINELDRLNAADDTSMRNASDAAKRAAAQRSSATGPVSGELNSAAKMTGNAVDPGSRSK